MIDPKIAQKKYFSYVRNTEIYLQNKMSGGKILDVEKKILEEINPKKILDIGCGSGERTFPFYEEKNIDFIGIEMEERLIENSPYKEKIIKGDICNEDFKIPEDNFELIVLWGVIQGFITEERRKIAYSNIKKIIKKSFLAFTTLINFEWFETGEKGEIVQLHPFLPYQYFPSKKEIDNILTLNGLKTQKILDGNMGVRLYLVTAI